MEWIGLFFFTENCFRMTLKNTPDDTPWRGVEPRSRATRRLTGACTNPIYYQGHDDAQKVGYKFIK